MKPLLGLLCLLVSVSGFAQPVTPIRLTLTPNTPDSGTGTLPVRAAIANTGTVAVAEVGITLHSLDNTGELSIPDPSWTCTGTGGGYLQCVHGPIAPQSTLDVDFLVRFPAGAGRARVRAYVDWTETYGIRKYGDQKDIDLALFRRFTVTNTADAGEGTLRNAIAALNADAVCTVAPCRIDFAIPDIAVGSWATIRPLTPLPAIIGPDLEVDATSQPDTNPLGPDVALLGTIISGDGLDVRSVAFSSAQTYAPQMIVRGFAIGGFPGNGIYYVPSAAGSRATIEKNYVGTDPTGTHAILNLGRGITVGEGSIVQLQIHDNVLSGNYRSGIYVLANERGFPTGSVLEMRRNRIGVAAASDAPIPNRASGIFVGPKAFQVLIEDNVIAHNAHFGIAVAYGARYTNIVANRIFDHPLPGIDRGLNGQDDSSFRAEIESASYDVATNTTTIVVRGPLPYALVFYANAGVDSAGYAEGEQLLGKATVADRNAGQASFTFTGDLRGKYVTATATYATWADASPLFETSEFLRAVRVENP